MYKFAVNTCEVSLVESQLQRMYESSWKSGIASNLSAVRYKWSSGFPYLFAYICSCCLTVTFTLRRSLLTSIWWVCMPMGELSVQVSLAVLRMPDITPEHSPGYSWNTTPRPALSNTAPNTLPSLPERKKYAPCAGLPSASTAVTS